jgi:DNA-binding response OmpR family regulator
MPEPRPRVLVVDDERFVREAIGEVLADAEIPFEAVGSGEEALAAAASPTVGAVVLDVTLPDVSGIEVLQRLQQARPSLRVLVLSAHSDEELVLEALRLGASDYLAKPLHDEELVLAVRRALAGFELESSWRRLQERVQRLDLYLAGLAEYLHAETRDEALEAFGGAAVEAVSQVLEAGKTSLMVFDEDRAELRVLAACGSPVDPTEMDPVALGEGVAGVALALGEAMVVDDVYSDERFAVRTSRGGQYETGSLAVVPLRARGRPLGVLCATDRHGGARFAPQDLALLKILAVPVACFLVELGEAVDAEAAPGLAQSAAELDAAPPLPVGDADADLAREICEALTLEIEPRRVIEAALRPVARRLEAEVVALHLIANATGELVREGQVDDTGAGDRERLPRNRGLSCSVLQTGGLVATDHPERDPRFDPLVDTAADGKLRPLLCVPLRLRGKVLGALRAFPGDGVGASARTGELLSAALSAAVRNVLLYRSLLEAIDELADARRLDRGGAGP